MTDEKTFIIRKEGEKALEIIRSIHTTKDMKNSSKEVLFYVNKRVQDMIRTADTSRIDELIKLIKSEFPMGSTPAFNPPDLPHIMGVKVVISAIPKIVSLLVILYKIKKLG